MLSRHQQKWIPAIVKLHQLTQEEKLKWHAEPPPKLLLGIKVDQMYVTEFKGMQMRLYEMRPESILSSAFDRLSSGLEQPKSTKIVLELLK